MISLIAGSAAQIGRQRPLQTAIAMVQSLPWPKSQSRPPAFHLLLSLLGLCSPSGAA